MIFWYLFYFWTSGGFESILMLKLVCSYCNDSPEKYLELLHIEACGPGIPSSMNNMIYFVWYGFSCQGFQKYKKVEKGCPHLIQKNTGDASPNPGIPGVLVALSSCNVLWLSHEPRTFLQILLFILFLFMFVIV